MVPLLLCWVRFWVCCSRKWRQCWCVGSIGFFFFKTNCRRADFTFREKINIRNLIGPAGATRIQRNRISLAKWRNELSSSDERCVTLAHRLLAMRQLGASLFGDAPKWRKAGRQSDAKRGVRFQRGVVDLKSNCSIKYKLLTNKRTSDKPLKNCHCDAFQGKGCKKSSQYRPGKASLRPGGLPAGACSGLPTKNYLILVMQRQKGLTQTTKFHFVLASKIAVSLHQLLLVPEYLESPRTFHFFCPTGVLCIAYVLR